tara:strand:+ start:2692 stop:3303 length:612 start_codon:yes stop_codon:yes gene_type:complete
MERSDIINQLIKTYNYKSYLEIGYGTGYTFNKINISTKVGIDGGNGTPPSDTTVVRIKSADYFKSAKEQGGAKFDIIFIDGSHLSEDVEEDLKGSLELLNEHGTIVMHDCSPPNMFYQERTQSPYVGGWTGDVWKAFVKFRALRADLSMWVVDTDYGCGVVRFGEQKVLDIDVNTDLEYKNLDENRKEWLNLITPEEFIEKYP